MRTIVSDAGPSSIFTRPIAYSCSDKRASLYLPRSVFNEVQTTLQIQEPWPEWLQIVSIFPHEQKEVEAFGKMDEL